MNQRFLDPLYGSVDIDDITRELIFSPEFQRLRYVRLCNINSLFLTGASEPKRFEHCVGTYHLARAWAANRRLPVRDYRIFTAAALLHDLQTGPFGHSFQYVLEDNPFDRQFEHSNISGGVRSQFLQRARAGASFAGRPFSIPELLGPLAEDVFAIIRGEGALGPLISGTLDLDNLDNVVRLAFHTGLCRDSDRDLPKLLAPLLDHHEGRLAVRGNARALLERWFHLRRQLYEYLLLDRGEFAAKAMLTMAVEAAVEAKLLGPDSWKLTDDELLTELEVASVGDHQMIGQIVRRLRVGDLFECVEVWATSQTNAYGHISEISQKRKLEHDIQYEATKLGGSRRRICLHYILDSRKTCRAIRYVDLASGNEETVGYDSNILLIGVFVANARATAVGAQDRKRYIQAASAVLNRAGLAPLEKVEEPLGLPAANQRGLFAA